MVKDDDHDYGMYVDEEDVGDDEHGYFVDENNHGDDANTHHPLQLLLHKINRW